MPYGDEGAPASMPHGDDGVTITMLETGDRDYRKGIQRRWSWVLRLEFYVLRSRLGGWNVVGLWGYGVGWGWAGWNLVEDPANIGQAVVRIHTWREGYPISVQLAPVPAR